LGLPGVVSVRFGVSTARPHGTVAPQRLGANDVVVLEGGCAADGYQSRLARTFVIGTPRHAERLFGAVAEAQSQLLTNFRAGAAFDHAHGAASRTLDDAARGAFSAAMSRYVAHGAGLEGYEAPYRQHDVLPSLQTGMVLTSAPTACLRGECGVQTTDLVHVTLDGPETLTGMVV
jgi:Xaa-Pro dipeptidase